MITVFRRHGGIERFEIPRARGVEHSGISSGKGGLDEDATRGKVWTFSGITHYKSLPPDLISR